MSVKIDRGSLSALLLFTFSFSFFYPSENIPGVITILRYSSILLTIIVLLFSRKQTVIVFDRSKRWGLVPVVYFFYQFLISLINGTEYASFSTFSALCQFFLIISLYLYLLKRNKSKTYNILLLVFAIFVVWDLIDIYSNPTGIANSYIWFLGNKNNHTLPFYVLIYLSVLKYKTKETKTNKALVFCIVMLTTIATYLLDSSTSIVSILFIDIGTILFFFYSGKIHIKCDYILIAAIVLNAVIIAGQTSFLKNIVSLFEKDLTFSNRTIVWERTLRLIAQKPIFGWGLIHGSEAKALIGYVNAHNQLLDNFLCGGIILLGFFIIILMRLSKKIEAVFDMKTRAFNTLFFSGILVKMFFEQIAGDYLFWILYLLMMSMLTSNSKKMEIINSYE